MSEVGSEVRPVIHDYIANDLIPSPIGKTVWDLGCGNGRFSAAFLAEGAQHILASDLHIPQLGAAVALRDDPRVDWLIGGFEEAAAHWGRPVPADIVFMSLMTEHVSEPRLFFRELSQIVGDDSDVLIHHDNYFQPVGHHDHGLLFLDAASWSITPQGPRCWDDPGKCSASTDFRDGMAIRYPNVWSGLSEATRDPQNCSRCNYFRRSQPCSEAASRSPRLARRGRAGSPRA